MAVSARWSLGGPTLKGEACFLYIWTEVNVTLCSKDSGCLMIWPKRDSFLLRASVDSGWPVKPRSAVFFERSTLLAGV